MHILIIDAEYLVALEAEQVLADAFACDVEIVMAWNALEKLDSGRFDVVLADALTASGELVVHLRKHHMAGKGLIFSSVDSSLYKGLADFPGVPVVAKPFDDERLVKLVRSFAISRDRL